MSCFARHSATAVASPLLEPKRTSVNLGLFALPNVCGELAGVDFAFPDGGLLISASPGKWKITPPIPGSSLEERASVGIFFR
jgi:hypothetical protein